MSDSAPSWFHRHPRTTLVVVACAGLVAVLALLELLAPLLFPQLAPVTGERASFWRYDDTLGWSHRAGQSGRFRHPDFDIDVRINSQGLRDDEYPIERGARRRLLVLGDSFAWGFGVEHRERFSELIEGRHPDWEVINAGVSGYGTDQELLYLRGRGIALRPDVVLLIFHENDFENNARSSEYWYAKPYFTLSDSGLVLHNTPVPPSTIKQRCNRFFYGRTYVVGRAYAALGALTREIRRPRWSRATRSAGADADALTAALLAGIDDVCRRASARLIVASVPGTDGLVGRLGDIAGRNGILYLPLDDAFAAAGGDATFEHDGHWTARGHAIAADALEKYFEDNGVFD